MLSALTAPGKPDREGEAGARTVPGVFGGGLAPLAATCVATPSACAKMTVEREAITMQTQNIFLASSSELKEDRMEFEIFINRKN